MEDEGLSKTGDVIFLTGSHSRGTVSTTGTAPQDPGHRAAALLGPRPGGWEGGSRWLERVGEGVAGTD